jgi:uncharacterized protein
MRTMSQPQVEKVLGALKTWSAKQPRVDALALVGSWTASRDHAECDLDVVCVVDDPDRFQAEQDWIRQIDWPSAGLAVKGWTEVDFGGARARHLTFDSGEEVEVSFVDRKWASTEPVDPVTRRLAGDGLRVLHDPRGLLGKLLVAL